MACRQRLWAKVDKRAIGKPGIFRITARTAERPPITILPACGQGHRSADGTRSLKVVGPLRSYTIGSPIPCGRTLGHAYERRNADHPVMCWAAARPTPARARARPHRGCDGIFTLFAVGADRLPLLRRRRTLGLKNVVSSVPMLTCLYILRKSLLVLPGSGGRVLQPIGSGQGSWLMWVTANELGLACWV